MPYKALSERVKHQKQSRANAAIMQNAVNAYRTEQDKPANLRKGARKIAGDYGIPNKWRTIVNRYNGMRSTQEAHEAQKNLLPAEEVILVDFLNQSAEQGFPQTLKNIENLATLLRKARLGDDCSALGENWVHRFLDRYREVLQTHWSKPLDTQRARAMNPGAKKAWFQLLEEFVVNTGIRHEDLYGMDETGCPPSDQGTQRVVGGRGTKTQHKQGGADRENVTAIVTICADGSTLKPTIIFKGQNFMNKWGNDNVSEASLAHSPNGWTDNELGLHWMVKDFDPQTKEKASGRTRVLLMDGHSSHYSLELLDHARANNIVILGYPPHCTHVLQGLDVVCFAKMKNEFRKEIQTFEDLHMHSVGKADFAGVFGRAFLRSFTEDAVKAAFAATGVYPFNPDAITEEQMKPSLPSSTKTSFPILQPSPVRAIIAAMGSHPPTSFELSPSMHTAQIANPSQSIPTTSSTPMRRQHDPEIDPELETPSKRMRMLYSALATTSSGSLLVSKTRITSATPILTPLLETLPELPHPNWSLLQQSCPTTYQALQGHVEELTENLSYSRNIIRARELIDEQKNAQLVIQHSHLTKLNQSLQTKESKTRDDRTKLFPKGLGRHLTAVEFCDELREQHREKEAKAAEKAKRKTTRVAKKVTKDVAKVEWERMLAEHKDAVARWEAQCVTLRGENVRVKDLPPKPKRPRKPKLASGGDVDVNKSSDSSEDDEGG